MAQTCIRNSQMKKTAKTPPPKTKLSAKSITRKKATYIFTTVTQSYENGSQQTLQFAEVGKYLHEYTVYYNLLTIIQR